MTVKHATCLSFFERVGVVGASDILSAKLAGVEGKIPMAARRHVTNSSVVRMRERRSPIEAGSSMR